MNASSSVTVEAATAGAEWDEYVTAHPEATSDHLWGWRAIFQDVFHHDAVYLTARRDGAIAGVLPLVLFKSRLFGRSVISLPVLNYGGLLASDDAAADALLARATTLARDFGGAHLELRHQHRQRPELPVREHKLMLVRPLPPSVDDLWKEIDRKVRNQVRKAEKEGLVAVVGGAELLDGFYSVFAENMRDLGTPVYPKALFVRTLEQFPDRARVFVVRHGDKTVAGAVALRFRDTVLVPWASSLRAYRNRCPNMLLYWTMLKTAVEEGAARFDFGQSSPDAGTHHFKLQWGARETPLHWEYTLLAGATIPDRGPSNGRFHLAINLWQRMPLVVANAIGPRLVRHIPDLG